MNRIRHSKIKKIISLILSLLLTQGLYSCKRQEISIDKSKLSSMSGEEIFKGIFFLEGQLPSEVDFLSKKLEITKDLKLDKNASSAKGQIMNEVIAEIKKTNPDYFTQLKEALYSKDYNALNESIQTGGDLLYVGLVQSNTMKSIMPQYKKIVDNLDMESYDFQEKSDVNRFLSDVDEMQTTESAASPQCLAGVVFVVAAAVVVTVAVAVSWVGVVQVATYALAFTSTSVHEGAAKINREGMLSSFDSELLTKDLMHAL